MRYLLSWLLATLALPTLAQNAQLFVKNTQPTLYVNCEQEVLFVLPEKHVGKKWTYTSNNGTVSLKTQRNDFAILQIKPNSVGKGIITASTEKVTETLAFEAVAIPSPELFLADSLKREVGIENPVTMWGAIQIIAKPQGFFANQLPKEANYQVTTVSTTVFREGRSVAKIRREDGKLGLETLKDEKNQDFLLKSGDGIQVTVESVVRLTSDGKTETVRLKQPYISFFVK